MPDLHLSSILKSLRLGKGPPAGADDAPNGDTRILRLGDVRYDVRRVNWDALMRMSDYSPGQHHFLQQGDILLVGRGSRRTAFLVTDPPPRTVADRTFFVARPDSDLVHPPYLAWYLNERKAQHYLRTHSRGTNIRTIKKSAVERIPVRLPDLDVQQQIAEIARLVRRERELVQEWINRREELAREVLRRHLYS